MALFRRRAGAVDNLSAASLTPCCCQHPSSAATHSPELSTPNRVVAQVETIGRSDTPTYANVHDHDLLTFGVRLADIPLLNALILDMVMNPSEDSRYETPFEQHARLRKTHPYSSRLVDAETFARWDGLFNHVTRDVW